LWELIVTNIPPFLDSFIHIIASASSIKGTGALSAGPYYIAANIGGGTSKLIGQFAFVPGIAVNMLARISDFRSHFTVYAESSDNLDSLDEGQIAICDGAGRYSQAATQILLGADGSIIMVVRHSKSIHVRVTDSRFSIAGESGQG
jgi:hypothetical protein